MRGLHYGLLRRGQRSDAGMGVRPLGTERRHSRRETKREGVNGNVREAFGNLRVPPAHCFAPHVPGLPRRDFKHLAQFGVPLRVSFENYVSDVDRGSDSI